MFVSGRIIIPNAKCTDDELEELFVITKTTTYGSESRTLYSVDSGNLILPRFSMLVSVYPESMQDRLKSFRKRIFKGLLPPNTQLLTSFPGDPWSPDEEKDRLTWSDPSFGKTERVVDYLFNTVLTKNKRKMGTMGAFVKARVGTGKTYIAFSMMRRLRCKCMFLFPDTDLADEKYKLAKKFFRVKIGRYYERYNEGGDIVMATVQSLLAPKKRPKHFNLKDFGFLAVDEAHKFGAKTFLNAFPKMRAELIVGFSGTPERLDGMERAVYCNVGPLINIDTCGEFEKPPEFSGTYRAILYKGPEEYTKQIINVRGHMDVSRTVSMVCSDPKRQSVIEEEIKDLLKNDHVVLVLSDRTFQLSDLEERGCGVVICGKTNAKERNETLQRALESKCLLSTYEYFGTGRSEESITSVVYASPRRNGHIQFSGRCMRLTTDAEQMDRERVIVDIVDENTKLKNQFSGKRRAVHRKFPKFKFEKIHK